MTPPDLSGGNDRIISFEASEEDSIEYQPTEDTLEDAAASPHEYNVYTERRVEVGPDRLEEWARANYDDETRVKITMKHGTDVFTRGEHVTTECPVCGEQPTLVKGFGDDREWVYMGDYRSCTLEVTDR
ncbi:hypothetical protein [Natrinema versiforme]|uniref:Uncharacterized protein n=1 Tax=Natrinema versiforme TaxID=88724 RepID=A0A4P8WMF2_9EURY|nr:hypothetical protein [Natrinema versiforme]QCS44690.1 hypothetical protein FEJ81_20550 [Natrinema versiforme]